MVTYITKLDYNKAADILEKMEFNRNGDYFSFNKHGKRVGCCTVGAIILAHADPEVSGTSTVPGLFALACDQLIEIIFDTFDSPRGLLSWSDHEATKEDALKLLRIAAERYPYTGP